MTEQPLRAGERRKAADGDYAGWSEPVTSGTYKL